MDNVDKVEKRIFRDANGRGYTIVTDDLDLEALHRLIVMRALEDAEWVQSNAAVILNISPRSMNYWVSKYGITHISWNQNCGLNGGYRKKQEIIRKMAERRKKRR